MRANDAVLGLLSRQDGLITAAQAAEHGLTERTLRRRVHDGGWARVAPGVVLAGGHPWTDRARVRAVGMWARGRGVVSGPAAAWWHGMPVAAPAQGRAHGGADVSDCAAAAGCGSGGATSTSATSSTPTASTSPHLR